MALPKLSAQQPITRPDLTPSTPFLLFMEKTREAQQATDAAQQELIDGLAQAVEDIQTVLGIANAAALAAAAADAKAVAAQAAADELLDQTLTLAVSTQAARSAANAAQTTADSALGAGTVSDAATDPAIDLTVTDEWVQGPQVDLTGVVAGNLTLTGTGPDTDADVSLSGGTTAQGEFRVMEIDAGVETLVFTGTFSAWRNEEFTAILNQSTSAVADFSEARTSTGAISYRIDARKTSGSAITSLSLYIYARRAA